MVGSAHIVTGWKLTLLLARSHALGSFTPLNPMGVWKQENEESDIDKHSLTYYT